MGGVPGWQGSSGSWVEFDCIGCGWAIGWCGWESKAVDRNRALRLCIRESMRCYAPPKIISPRRHGGHGVLVSTEFFSVISVPPWLIFIPTGGPQANVTLSITALRLKVSGEERKAFTAFCGGTRQTRIRDSRGRVR